MYRYLGGTWPEEIEMELDSLGLCNEELRLTPARRWTVDTVPSGYDGRVWYKAGVRREILFTFLYRS